LSPVYDLNPNPAANGLHLNIDTQDNRLSLDLTLSVAGYFRLSLGRAKEIIGEVTKATYQWREVARSLK